MTLKIPPPPFMTGELQPLNRWLLEIQSILQASGEIDPNSIAGLPALFLQVAAQALQIAGNTANIAANSASIAALNASVTVLQGQVTTLNAAVATLQGQVTALLARNQILNGNGAPAALLGNNGDLYLNNTGGAGTRLYGKIAGAWVVIA